MKLTAFILERYRTVANYIGTIIVAWLLSALVSQVVAMFIPQNAPLNASAPTEPAAAPSIFSQGQTVDDFMQICERNIFDSEKRTMCSEELDIAGSESQFDPNAAPVKSDIGAKLLGTMVLSQSSSFATIEVNGSPSAKTYKVGETFAGEARIYDIERNKVFFNRNGKKEYIEVAKLPQFSNTPSPPAGSSSSDAGIKKDGDKITLSRAKVESTLDDLNKILQDSRMVPNYENGKVTGFKIFAIRRGSIFDQLGLKNGDVIKQINGTQIDSLEKALPMLQMVKTESNVSIDMLRRGSKKTLDITIQ